jgi:phage baseplate assembly protein W
MSRWKDFDINLTKQADGDIKTMNDLDAIKNSIHNIFLTFQGTRRMLPDFNYGPYQLLFNPMDEQTAIQIGEGLLAGIERWEDRIIINNLHVEADPDKHLYKILLNVSQKGIPDSEMVIEEILKAM